VADDLCTALLHDSREAFARLGGPQLRQLGLIGTYEAETAALTARFAVVALSAVAILFRVGHRLTGVPTPRIARAWTPLPN
jgi:hypothetical protein